MEYFEKLHGLRLFAITLGSASCSFEFEGKIEGKFHRYSLGSAFETCFELSDVFKKDLIRDESLLKIWDYFDHVLEKIEISADGRVCELKMSGDQSIYVWSLEASHDNLLVARRWDSTEWFVIG
jgi:hypothetical protein